MFFMKKIMSTAEVFYRFCDDQDARFKYQREYIDWKFRRMNFIFNSKRHPGCQFHFQLVDRIKMPCRIYSVAQAPERNIISETVPVDILVGYGGLNKHYRDVERYFNPGWVHEFDRVSRIVRASWSSELSKFHWNGPHVPMAFIHLADPDFNSKIGDEIVLDGAILFATMTRTPYDGTVTYRAARAAVGENCVFFWPSHRNIEELADDILLLDENVTKQRFISANPKMHCREQAQLEMKEILRLGDLRRQELIRLGYNDKAPLESGA